MKRAVLDALLAARAAKAPVVLLTALDDGAQALVEPDGLVRTGTLEPPAEIAEIAAATLASDRCRTLETASGPLFVAPINPPLRLVIVGAVHIAQALAPMASLAGYDVTIVDPRRAFATDERFPEVALVADWPDDALETLKPDARTAIVTLTHDPKLDDPALDRALRSDAFYIAALGSTRTHVKRCARLANLGHDEAARTRIHGPAGLPIGAATPAEIAVSVLAQMTHALRRRG